MIMNIVIPMAGRGSRFSNAGYALPKPLIEICGIPMIKLVINNLRPKQPHQFIFLALKEHIEKFKLCELLSIWSHQAVHIISIGHVTEGAACTVLLAKKIINNIYPLMIANSDQWIDVDINSYLNHLSQPDIDGLIMTMTAADPKWSFLSHKGGFVTQVVEKKVISNEATVGIYNFKHGSDFVKAAELMIHKNIRTNNEFYVAPTYNELIHCDKKISFYNIGKEGDGMYGLGTPEDLKIFENKFMDKNFINGFKL